MKKYTIDWWQKKLNENDKSWKIFSLNHFKKLADIYKVSGRPWTYLKLTQNNTPTKKVLSNIPYALKDNISTKNIETYCGSNILRGYKPSYDATIVKLLKKAGASLLMKTILDELGMAGTGLMSASNKLFSPWNPRRIVGGSSSGSCFVVTTGMVPFAIGSDTGDSVRRPAALNGIIGFKPSWGSISRFGLMPFAPSLDTIAWFANTINDCTIILDVLNVNDPHDVSMNPEKLVKNVKKEIKIGIDKSIWEKVKKKEMSVEYSKLLDYLSHQDNIKLIEINIKKLLLNLAWPTYVVIAFTEALSSNFNLGAIHFGTQKKGDSFASIVHQNRSYGFGENVKKRFSLAALVLDSDNQKDIYIKAKKVRHMVQQMYDLLFEKVDLIISPASDDIAPFVSDVHSSEIIKQPNWIVDYAVFANLNGHTSLTLPIGYANDYNDSLPFSISIEAAQGNEYFLLDFAKQLEKKIAFKNKLQENNNV